MKRSSACVTGALRALLELELTIKYPGAFEGQGRQKHKALDGGLAIHGEVELSPQGSVLLVVVGFLEWVSIFFLIFINLF